MEPRIDFPAFLLTDDLADDWLNPNENKDQITSLIQPYPTQELTAHTVRRLRGKEYMGNLRGISEPFEYTELKF